MTITATATASSTAHTPCRRLIREPFIRALIGSANSSDVASNA